MVTLGGEWLAKDISRLQTNRNMQNFQWPMLTSLHVYFSLEVNGEGAVGDAQIHPIFSWLGNALLRFSQNLMRAIVFVVFVRLIYHHLSTGGQAPGIPGPVRPMKAMCCRACLGRGVGGFLGLCDGFVDRFLGLSLSGCPQIRPLPWPGFAWTQATFCSDTRGKPGQDQPRKYSDIFGIFGISRSSPDSDIFGNIRKYSFPNERETLLSFPT